MSDVSTRNTSATLTTPTLVYDGDCAFCMTCVRFVTRRTKKPLTTVAYQTANLVALGLTREQCADAVQWVDGDGHRSAHIAVAEALRHARFPWPIAGFVISLPLVRTLASLVYQRVAARRRCAAPTPPAAS